METSTFQNSNGDGISLYEEYRGFEDEIVKECRKTVELEMDMDDEFVLTNEEIEAIIEQLIIVTTLKDHLL